MKVSKQFKDMVLPKRMRGSQLDNEYRPKMICVRSSVEPETSGFNETFEHIHKQLKQK